MVEPIASTDAKFTKFSISIEKVKIVDACMYKDSELHENRVPDEDFGTNIELDDKIKSA